MLSNITTTFFEIPQKKKVNEKIFECFPQKNEFNKIEEHNGRNFCLSKSKNNSGIELNKAIPIVL